MWEWEFLETEFERGWNFENDLRVRDFKEKLNCENWDFGSWISKENWVFEIYLEIRVSKIILRLESWKIKFKNWYFGY